VKVREALVALIRKAAAYNAGSQVAPACVLWTDKDRQWTASQQSLRQDIPELLKLGDLDLDQGRGPAVWLKCALVNALTDFSLPEHAVPVVYLPNVSRADLRAIETCPRDLQPLAELQYRGVFWSQSNGKDWTVNAFLTSKNGGLGLDVAQDKATQEALIQAVEAGVLLERPVVELMGRSINAAWLNSLLAPNPTRDLLVWMNDPEAAHAKWSKQQWAIFDKRAKADFGFDPKADGVLLAAEKLAKAEGQWAAVSELYKDSFGSFPKIFDLLA
jgi:hypothetical protein